MLYVRNWRDVQPKIAHLSAVHWGGLRSRKDDEPDPDDDRDRLDRLGGFARHALQGRETSGPFASAALENRGTRNPGATVPKGRACGHWNRVRPSELRGTDLAPTQDLPRGRFPDRRTRT